MEVKYMVQIDAMRGMFILFAFVAVGVIINVSAEAGANPVGGEVPMWMLMFAALGALVGATLAFGILAESRE